MCSFGFLPEELEGAAFLFAAGDTIDISWNPKEKKLLFERRHGIEKCSTTMAVDEEEARKLTFFTMLTNPSDIIQIVD